MPAARQRSRSPSVPAAVIARMGGRRLAGEQLPDLARRLVAVDVGHVAVHQDRDVGPLPRHPDGLPAVHRDVGHVAELLEHAHGHALVDGVVLGHQHTSSRQRRRVRGGRLRRLGGRPRVRCAAPWAIDRPSGASSVNQNCDPTPTVLDTPIVPPRLSTSPFEIARPRPVPPNRRVVEASACVNFSNSRRCVLLGDADARVGHGHAQRGARLLHVLAAPRVTCTDPASVNLIALPTRLNST